MNKIYKVIWSKTKQCYVAVSEMAKRSGKGGSLVQKEETRPGGMPVRDGSYAAGGVVSTTGGQSYSYSICCGRCAAVLALAVSLWLARPAYALPVLDAKDAAVRIDTSVANNMNITFVGNSKEDKLIATAKLIKDGRSTSYVEVEILDKNGKKIAYTTVLGFHLD